MGLTDGCSATAIGMDSTMTVIAITVIVTVTVTAAATTCIDGAKTTAAGFRLTTDRRPSGPPNSTANPSPKGNCVDPRC